MAPVQCPNCGGSKTDDGLRWIDPQNRSPLKTEPPDSRITLSYILMPFAAILVGITIGGLAESSAAGWASAALFVILEIAVLNYARGTRAKYWPVFGYECRLCGHRWQPVEGD
jgi:hypothetical protein